MRRNNSPSCHVSRFQWEVDVVFRFQKERHIEQLIADGNGFDVSRDGLIRRIRHERQRFGGRGQFFIGLDFGPNRRVDALRIANGRRLQIDDQQMNLMTKRADCMFDEFPKCFKIALIPR